MATPTPEQRAYQVKMNPVLEAMRRVLTGRKGKDVAATESVRKAFEADPKEFMKVYAQLENLHERRRALKEKRFLRKRREKAAAGGTTPDVHRAGGPNQPAADAGPLPDVLARLLGGK